MQPSDSDSERDVERVEKVNCSCSLNTSNDGTVSVSEEKADEVRTPKAYREGFEDIRKTPSARPLCKLSPCPFGDSCFFRHQATPTSTTQFSPDEAVTPEQVTPPKFNEQSEDRMIEDPESMFQPENSWREPLRWRHDPYGYQPYVMANEP